MQITDPRLGASGVIPTGAVVLCAGPVPTVTTLTLSSRRKATLFRIILWRCSATAEHEIAEPKPIRDSVFGNQPVVAR
jgi:hypothetical protein